MTAKKFFFRIVALGVLVATFAGEPVEPVLAQAHGGAGGGAPGGGPPGGMPGGGMPGGGMTGGGPPGLEASGFPQLPSQAMEHLGQGRPDWAGRPDTTGRPAWGGRPEWAGRPADPGAKGIGRAVAARSQGLSLAQQDRARELVTKFPADYELDRNGALAIRGEVLATNLSDKALAAAQGAGFTIVRRTSLDGLGLSLVVLQHADWALDKMIDQLRRLAPDAAIEADHIFFTSGTKATRAAPPNPAARGPAPAGAKTTWRLGIIDTGAATAASGRSRINIVRRGFASGGFVPSDHGTAVAEIAARFGPSEPSARTAGTLFIADIFGAGPRGGSAEQMVRALAWMAQQNVPVTNISMVGPYNEIVARAIATLGRRGFLVVAPVGNDGAAARPLFPASLRGVVAVTAVDGRGAVLPEASRVRKVDFASRGIFSVPDMKRRTVEVRGTSFASPVVARRLAELLPTPDPKLAKTALRALASTAWKPKRGSERSALGQGIIGFTPLDSH